MPHYSVSWSNKETDTERYVRQYQDGDLYTGYVDKVESQESGLNSESKSVLHMTVVADIADSGDDGKRCGYPELSFGYPEDCFVCPEQAASARFTVSGTCNTVPGIRN